eukprot:2679235-Prymnesium_polylepis.1
MPIRDEGDRHGGRTALQSCKSTGAVWFGWLGIGWDCGLLRANLLVMRCHRRWRSCSRCDAVADQQQHTERRVCSYRMSPSGSDRCTALPPVKTVPVHVHRVAVSERAHGGLSAQRPSSKAPPAAVLERTLPPAAPG